MPEPGVVVLEGLAGRLSLQYEGRIITAQDAPSRPENSVPAKRPLLPPVSRPQAADARRSHRLRSLKRRGNTQTKHRNMDLTQRRRTRGR